MSAPLPLSLQGIQTPGVQPVNPWGTEPRGSQSKYKIPKTMEELEALSQNLIKDFDEVEKLRATLKIVKENRQVSELKIQNYDAQLAEIAAKQAEIQTKRAEIQAQRAEIQTQRDEIQVKQAADNQRREEIRQELDKRPSDAALLARLAKIRAAKAQAIAQQ